MRNVKLTDRAVAALQPAPNGERRWLGDTLVTGFQVQVTDRGAKSFILYARYPGTGHPARRFLGRVGDLPLAAAREKARAWRSLIAQGIDPKAHEASQRIAAEQRRSNTFEAVAEAYIEAVVSSQRSAAAAAREIRRELIERWGRQPVADVTMHDVLAMTDDMRRRGVGSHGRNVFGHLSRIFRWAIARRSYGLERSPCENLRPTALIGERKPRRRVLSDEELRACWVASGGLGYPYGHFTRLLMLTGARRDEIGEGRWPEIDLDAGSWILPPERFKSDRTHVIALSSQALAILNDLPRFAGGPFVFTCVIRAKPATDSDAIRPPIPTEVGHLFRSNPATQLGWA